MKITKELSKFNNIKFHDENHAYYMNGVKNKICYFYHRGI